MVKKRKTKEVTVTVCCDKDGFYSADFKKYYIKELTHKNNG